MKKTLIVLLLAILIPLQIAAEEAKTVVAACDPWPPFVDPHHPKGGLSLEIVSAAFHAQGYTVQYKNIPWARAEDGVDKGIYDILPDVWATASRKKNLMFSIPYAKNKIKFITLKDDPFEYDGLNSLREKTIGTIRGYGYNDEFMNATHYTRSDVTDFTQNIKKLLANRINLMLEDEIVAKHKIVQENPQLLDQLKFCKTPLAIMGLHIAVGYSNPRHQEIIEAFNAGFEIIEADGCLADILKRYLDNE